MIIRMFNMSPETLVHREVGNNISNKDKRVIEMLDDNLSYVDGFIKHCGNFGTSSDYTNIDYMTDDFDPESLSELTKDACYKLMFEIDDKMNYYASGHEYIKGVDNVLDNIDRTLSMKNDLSFAKELNITVAGNGSTYDKSTIGVIPEGMTFLFNYRKSVKNEMNDKKRLLQEKIAKLAELESV